GRGRDLAAVARKPDQLDAAAKKFRRAAFVDRDMRSRVTEHRAPGRREMRQRQRIRTGPGRQQKDRHVVLEQLGEPRLDAPGPVVIAIGQRGAVVRPRNGGEDLGRDPGSVVAGEIHVLSRANGEWRMANRVCFLLFAIRYSLFATHYSLFAIRYSLL